MRGLYCAGGPRGLASLLVACLLPSWSEQSVEGRRLGKSGCTDALCTPCEQDLAEFCNLGVADLQIWKAGAGREACKGCVASAVMGTSNFAGKRCSSLELWALCAKQEKAERELAISCAGQMKHSCGRHFFIGAKCAECVKLHSARMDFGLIDKSPQTILAEPKQHLS